MRHALDQPQHSQPLELARHDRGRELKMFEQIGPSPTVDVEFASLHGSEQRLVGGVEEVQSLDRRVVTYPRLAQPLEIAFTGRGVVQAGEKRQVALVAAEQNLAQVDQAEESTSSAAPARAWPPRPCVPPCGGA